MGRALRLAVMGVPVGGGGGLYFVDLFSSVLPGWLGAGSVAAGALTITPAAGDELLTDPGLEDWSSATNLTHWSESIVGSTTVNQETTVIHGGANAARVAVDASNNGYGIAQVITAAAGALVRILVWARVDAGSGKQFYVSTGDALPAVTVTAAYAQYLYTWLLSAANPNVLLSRAGPDAGVSLYFDDISIVALTTPYHGRQHPVNYGTLTAKITLTARTQAGVWFHGNDAASPTSYDHVYLGGNGKIYWDKVIAGTRTLINNAAITYVADAALVVLAYQDGTFDITYNGTSVVTGVAATTNTGRYFGLYSSDPSNSFSEVSMDSRDIP